MDNVHEQLTFGNVKDDRREWIYARYACGDPLSLIASELNMSVDAIYEIMRECPEQYEETKVKRENFNGVRLCRSLALHDAYNLRVLEALTEGTLKETLTADVLKELAKIGKSLAHRVQLYEGKATEIFKHQEERLTVGEVKEKIQRAEAAGLGLDEASIEPGGEQ